MEQQHLSTTAPSASDLGGFKHDYPTLGAERIDVALQAAYEIEAIGSLIRTTSEADLEDMKYAYRGLSLRLGQLANLIVSTLSDPAETTAGLACRLRGEPDVAIMDAGREVHHG